MENLTAYELWQLQTKGNILPETGGPKFENSNTDMDAAMQVADRYEQSLLLDTF
jgi:hypothetical protein